MFNQLLIWFKNLFTPQYLYRCAVCKNEVRSNIDSRYRFARKYQYCVSPECHNRCFRDNVRWDESEGGYVADEGYYFCDWIKVV